MKGHKFRTAQQAKQWLARVQRVVTWKDNTIVAPTFVETRTAYPLRLRLPPKVDLHGPLTVYLSLPGRYMLGLTKAKLRQIEQIANFTGAMRLMLDYFPTEDKWPPTLGFKFQEKKLRVQFKTGLRFEEVEASCDVLRAVFKEFGVAAQFRKVKAVPNPLNRGKPVYLSAYGIKEGYHLVAPEIVQLKQSCSGPVGPVNPNEVEFTCPGMTPAEALRRINSLLERRLWPVGKGLLVFAAEGKRFENHPQRTARLVAMLNAADFPCKRAELELWYRLRRWQDFPVLQKMAAMDMEGSPAETEIWQIGVGQGMPGFLEASATRKTFCLSAFPTNAIANDETRGGKFYAEWGKRLAQIKS